MSKEVLVKLAAEITLVALAMLRFTMLYEIAQQVFHWLRETPTAAGVPILAALVVPLVLMKMNHK